MEEIESPQKRLLPTQKLDHFANIVWHKEHVLPGTGLESLRWIGSERAKVRELTTSDRILVAPCAVQILRLEEASEVGIDAIDERFLV